MDSNKKPKEDFPQLPIPKKEEPVKRPPIRY
jgi:hypothetical protein